MAGLDYVIVGKDAQLRDLADAVQARAEAKDVSWYRHYALVRTGDGYRGIHLPALSAVLEDIDWTLDTPLADLPLVSCAVVSADVPERDARRGAREALVVAEEGGEPVALYQGATVLGAARSDHRGWWRLLGKRMAEQGEKPPWPDPPPKPFAWEEVLSVEATTTLSALGALLQERDEDTVLAIRGEGGGWATVSAGELLDRITDRYPDAAPGSMVGALAGSDLPEMASLERGETPWELVEELMPKGRTGATQFLVVAAGEPVGVLTRREVMRGGRPSVPKGVAPLGLTPSWERFSQAAGALESSESDQGRVVNAWFADQKKEPVLHTDALAANTIYYLGVNIGALSENAHVVGEQPPIDARLVSYLLGEGLPLVVRVDSEDFWVLDGEEEISLPQGGTSDTVHLRVATPVWTGLAYLRLGVYFENNLVQSYLVHAHVAPVAGAMPEETRDGWWSECEYTLSADLSDLSGLASRRVCVWIGEGKGDGYRAGISESTGMDMGPALEVNTGLRESALSHYRGLLSEACFEDPESEKPQYRYNDDHTPRDDKTFRRALLQLAELGQMLYDRVLGTENGQRVARQLREIEQTQQGPLVLQIARLSLDATFPWAVLYDRPLRFNPGRNVVCERFADEVTCGQDCPHVDDDNVVCPYGFWGFRYVIEQPLRPPGSYSSVATTLPGNGRPQVSLVFGTGLGLAQDHRSGVEQIIGTRAEPTVYESTDALLQAMQAGPAVVYFYCHGGNTPFRQWLVVRDDDPLAPTYLGEHLRKDWADGAPLVVLNGCHTGKYDPSTLLSFVHRFGALGAAGVVGTEIPIHEYLGDAFGRYLLEHLLDGVPVGQVVYDFRRELLGKHNVLGLVYVPYCYADLKLERA